MPDAEAVGMDTRHSTMLVDGMQLHWAECGPASDKVPVVLLHGLHDSHLTWKRIAPLLAAGRRVLMPDLLGCGLSEKPDASYEIEWHARVVAQLLLLDPELRVRRLALIASGGLGPHVGFWLRLATLPGVVEHLGQPFMG